MIKSSILVSTLAFTLSFVHAHEDTAFLPRYAPDTSKEHLFKRQNGNYPPILVNGALCLFLRMTTTDAATQGPRLCQLGSMHTTPHEPPVLSLTRLPLQRKASTRLA